MGILNVMFDSFLDGGEFNVFDVVIVWVVEMVN